MRETDSASHGERVALLCRSILPTGVLDTILPMGGGESRDDVNIRRGSKEK